MPVYKDKKRDTWYYSIYYKDTQGKAKRKVKRGFKTKKACKIAESEMLQRIRHDYSDNQSFENVFFDRLKHADLSSRTIENREYEYEKYLKRRFGTQSINRITVEQCRKFRQDLMEDDTLSSGYKRAVFAGFKATLSYAEKHYNVVNPSRSVDPIKGKNSKTNSYITREEFDSIVLEMDDLSNHNPVMYRKFFQLLFYTGLRVGEALPLTWEDFDSNKRELNINKTIDIWSSEIRYGQGKTENSLDTIPLPKHIVQMLDEMKQETDITDNPFIFGGKKPIHYNTLRKNFYEVFQKNGHNIRIHHLRHSYATHLINNGVDIYLLSKLMRHSNFKQTVDTYSHLYTDRKHEVMKIFDED